MNEIITYIIAASSVLWYATHTIRCVVKADKQLESAYLMDD